MKRLGQHAMLYFLTGCAALCVTSSTQAQTEIPTSNWSLMLGGGGLASPIYSGSDKLQIKPLPLIDARYRLSSFEFFVSSMEGAGISFTEQRSGLMASIGTNFGEGRENDADDVKTLLRGTATITSPAQAFASLSIPVPFFPGAFAASVNFHPLTAEYDEAGRSDKDYSGLVVDFGWSSDIPVRENMFMNVAVGTSFMNDDYAEALYGVDYPTSKFNVYTAKKGIKDVNASLALRYMFHQKIGAMLFGSGSQLLENAADSPLTQQDFQIFTGIGVFYTF